MNSLVACSLYNHELISMQEEEEDKFVPKMIEICKKIVF